MLVINITLHYFKLLKKFVEFLKNNSALALVFNTFPLVLD